VRSTCSSYDAERKGKHIIYVGVSIYHMCGSLCLVVTLPQASPPELCRPKLSQGNDAVDVDVRHLAGKEDNDSLIIHLKSHCSPRSPMVVACAYHAHHLEGVRVAAASRSRLIRVRSNSARNTPCTGWIINIRGKAQCWVEAWCGRAQCWAEAWCGRPGSRTSD